MSKPRSLDLVLRFYKQADKQFPKRLSLYLARFNFVTELGEVEMGTMRGHTAKGYEAGLRLALAETAIEAMESGLILNKGQFVIRDKHASRLIRSLRGSQFEEYLSISCKSDGLRANVHEVFASQKLVDLRPIVKALRNSVFHGAYTSHSIGFTSSKEVRLLLDYLFHIIVDQLEVEFDAYAARLSKL